MTFPANESLLNRHLDQFDAVQAEALIKELAGMVRYRPASTWADWVIYIMEALDAPGRRGQVEQALIVIGKAIAERLETGEWLPGGGNGAG